MNPCRELTKEEGSSVAVIRVAQTDPPNQDISPSPKSSQSSKRIVTQNHRPRSIPKVGDGGQDDDRDGGHLPEERAEGILITQKLRVPRIGKIVSYHFRVWSGQNAHYLDVRIRPWYSTCPFSSPRLKRNKF